MATARVPVAMPARSMKWKSGSTPTTTMEPGGLGFSRETERLVDPASRQGQAVGDVADQPGSAVDSGRHGWNSRQIFHRRACPPCGRRICCLIQA